MRNHCVTSESVTEGHPDKLCDQISDGILDAYLEKDPKSRVAVETLACAGTIIIAGEVTSNANIEASHVARRVTREIGYTSERSGLDAERCLILTNFQTQSKDIAHGVGESDCVTGAGDQGIMYGYACDESETYMPVTHFLATKLCMRLADVRRSDPVSRLFPDGKSQVTMEYRNGEPSYISNIIISAHHEDGVSLKHIREYILKEVVYPVIDNRWLRKDTKILINPAGSFSIGGPAADTGLTGRKLMADTYGSIGKHGGGAFSGKDPTKVDRSGAYMARYVAKNIVAARLAKKCEVMLAYAIGQPEPVALSVDTFNTERVPIDIIKECAENVFSYSVRDIIKHLDLLRPQYQNTAAYGHFGREDQGFKWEETDMCPVLIEYAAKQLVLHRDRNQSISPVFLPPGGAVKP